MNGFLVPSSQYSTTFQDEECRVTVSGITILKEMLEALPSKAELNSELLNDLIKRMHSARQSIQKRLMNETRENILNELLLTNDTLSECDNLYRDILIGKVTLPIMKQQNPLIVQSELSQTSSHSHHNTNIGRKKKYNENGKHPKYKHSKQKDESENHQRVSIHDSHNSNSISKSNQNLTTVKLDPPPANTERKRTSRQNSIISQTEMSMPQTNAPFNEISNRQAEESEDPFLALATRRTSTVPISKNKFSHVQIDRTLTHGNTQFDILNTESNNSSSIQLSSSSLSRPSNERKKSLIFDPNNCPTLEELDRLALQ